ncbi:MAG: tRNA adenosine(34) deaminase TadA [Bacillota bacterium]
MSDEEFMREALAEARKAEAAGEVPIGAVVVADGRLVARGHNRREELNDPTAHAEILALREAGEKLGGWRLRRATLFVTVEPCPMCAGAMVQSRLGRLVYGARDLKAGAVESTVNLVRNKAYNHQVEVRAGCLEDECAEVMSRFFAGRRDREGD